MVRAVTTHDAEWTEDDLAAALDWCREDAMRCSGCGHPMDETMDPDLARAWDAEIVVCHGCEARDRTDRAFREQEKADTAGIRPRVWRRPPLGDD